MGTFLPEALWRGMHVVQWAHILKWHSVKGLPAHSGVCRLGKVTVGRFCTALILTAMVLLC